LAEDLGAFGVDSAILENLEPDKDPVFHMWPGCIPVLRVFLGLGTQWAYYPSGVISGLNYQSAQVEIEMQGIDPADRKQLWFDLKTMEHAAIEALKDYAERSGP